MKQGQYTWQYHHRENAWSVVHAFSINSTDLNSNPVLKQKLLEIATIEHNNHLRGGTINITNQSDTSWLIAMKKMGYRYACIWFDGCWPHDHDFNDGLLAEIDRINAEFGSSWMVAGNIDMIEKRYAHFSRDIIIINIEQWIEAGEPDPTDPQFDQVPFGYYSRYKITQQEELIELWQLYEAGVVEAYEDYPYGLQSFGPIMQSLLELVLPEVKITDEEFNDNYQEKFCNSLLTYALKQDLFVPGLSETFMKYITLTKPHIGSIEFEKAITGQDYQTDSISYQANKVAQDMFSPSSPIYFVNTEPSMPEVADELLGTGFDQYCGATAGFKLFYYAYKYGFTSDTKFILYDFDPLSCRFKEDTLNNWNGEDYPAWVKEWVKEHPEANSNLLDLTTTMWPKVVNEFGGKTEWLDTWKRIQKSKWVVRHIDLIADHDQLFKLLENKRTFMWTSNIYSYIIPKMLYGPFEMESSFIELISNLKSLHNDSWFCGTDINDNDLMCPVTAILSTSNNDSIGFEQ